MKKTKSIADAAAYIVEELTEHDKKCHWVCSLRLREIAGTTACQSEKSMILNFRKENYEYIADI